MPVGHDTQGAGAKHRSVTLDKAGASEKKRSGKGGAKVAWRGKSTWIVFNLSPQNEQKECESIYRVYPPRGSVIPTSPAVKRMTPMHEPGREASVLGSALSLIPVDPIWDLTRKEVAIGGN